MSYEQDREDNAVGPDDPFDPEATDEIDIQAIRDVNFDDWLEDAYKRLAEAQRQERINNTILKAAKEQGQHGGGVMQWLRKNGVL